MNNTKPLWHGIMLVAGGAIGAGIFALPTASSGAWMLWATIGFIFVWAMTFAAAYIQTQVNLALVTESNFGLSSNSSFDAHVTCTLGRRWAIVNNLSIAFIMVILMYAYSTAGGSIIHYTLSNLGMMTDEAYRPWFSLVFATIIGLVVYLGTSFVSSITLLLMFCMAVLFWLVGSSLLPHVTLSQLAEPTDTFPFLFAALPVLITAFACGGLVPSLVRHYPIKPSHVFKSLFWGTLLALIVYLVWLALTFGVLERSTLIELAKKGGDLGSLVGEMVAAGGSDNINARLTLFSHFAIITSFLSVGIGFIHFIRDKLSLNENKIQGLLAATICFMPPAFASFFFPYGFVYAIGLAGFFVAFSFFLVPSFMAYSIRKPLNGNFSMMLFMSVVLFGVLIVVLKSLATFALLPSP